MSKGNPWDDPNWAPLKREATLVRQLLGSGVTSLGKASYADGLGNYYNAFFGLSIGLERLAKLICVCDYAIDNKGAFPPQKMLKQTYGHNIPKLLEAVAAIQTKRKLSLRFGRPTGNIQSAIVTCLASFAEAREGRYNNFDALDNAGTASSFEPLQKWWDEVAEPILGEHFYETPVEAKQEQNSQMIEAMTGGFSMVIHFDELGQLMDTMYTTSFHTGKTKVVQKWGRYYTLTIVRWLAEVFSDLSMKATYDHELTCFFGHKEYFDCYRTDDSFLKTRKIWPLKH